jgi:hypothetical protein
LMMMMSVTAPKRKSKQTQHICSFIKERRRDVKEISNLITKTQYSDFDWFWNLGVALTNN